MKVNLQPIHKITISLVLQMIIFNKTKMIVYGLKNQSVGFN
jgi:hypothetical protein